MKRLAAVVVCVGVMACGSERSRAQKPVLPAPASPAPASPAITLGTMLVTAVRVLKLRSQADDLFAEGKLDEAIAVAEQRLALQEKTFGPRHLSLASALNNLSLLYYEQANYAKAVPLMVRATDILEKALSPNHVILARAFMNLAALYKEQAAYAKAEPLLRRALTTYEAAHGPLDPDVADCLSRLAAVYSEQAAYDKAEPLFRRALEIRELTPLDPSLAVTLSDFSSLYRAKGNYAEAETLALRALSIQEKTLDPLHPHVASSLANLASIHVAQGAYDKAEPLLVHALAIQEKLPNAQVNAASSLVSLGTLYQVQSAYDKAEPLLIRALAIQEKTLGPLHPEVAFSLAALASNHYAQGAYAKAEPLMLRAVAIRENALGSAHPDIATDLISLSAIYDSQGAYAKAEPLLLRALTIYEKAFGPFAPNVAACLNNLAALYYSQGAFAKAQPLLLRALAIQEKGLPKNHPDIGTSFNNLAVLYDAQGAHAKAEPLYLRALDIQQKTLPPWHPDVGLSLHNLAMFHHKQGAYAKAEPLYLRALEVLEKAVGPLHPNAAIGLHNLGMLYLAQRDQAKAERRFIRAANLREAQLRTELSRLPEPRKRALMQMLRGEAESLVSFHAHDGPRRSSALKLALTTVLRNKGRVLDSLADNQATLRSSLTPPLREQLDQLTEARAQLTVQLYGRNKTTDRTSRRNQLDALRTRIEELESALSTASAEFRSQTEPVTIAKVQAALPAGSALVELVHYHRFDARDYSDRWKEERYLAYVLRPSGPPTWVALGEAGPIDAEVNALQAAMHREPGMAQEEIERRQQQARAALEKLHGLLMAPLAGSLQGVSHLLIAPDGKLNLVPFEALVDGKGEYVLQRHLVSYLSSGRDLLRLATKRRAASGPTIVAAPDYGAGKPFAALPGALAEGQQLHRSFPQSKLLTGPAASKEALAKLVGPSVLHVATHGFYARGGNAAGSTTAKTPPRDPTRGMFIESFDSALPMPPPPEGDEFDALDRAGLALAGANSSADGLITAREIAGLNWSGTQLVVLSACETGIGAVATGEGVYGLRRALVLSGAQAQVVSLWNVADASTLALMKTFYAELARGTGRAEALRRAKLALLQEPRYAHPYYWAPFIPAGDWRPLDSSVFAKR